MNEKIEGLVDNIEKVILGKRDTILKIIAAMLCGGHVLIEDVPGVGKTQLVAALARSVNGRFNRIQLTPDIMPSDIVGFTMIDPETKKFVYRKGVAVCNFLLADEINRASPKVQSGLLEIMEEQQISIDSNTYNLPKPFMTLATQNPVETYGTYHLPEAQMDRFLIRISMGYLNPKEEMQLFDRPDLEKNGKNLSPVLTIDEVLQLQKEAEKIYVNVAVKEYIMRIVNATRDNENIKLGISPRGSIGLNSMAKAVAFIKGKTFATPDDVISVAPIVLAHRLILSQRGKGVYKTQEAVIEDIIRRTTVPNVDM